VRIRSSRLIIGRALGGFKRRAPGGSDREVGRARAVVTSARPKGSGPRDLDATALRLLADTVAGGMPFERALDAVARGVERPQVVTTLRLVQRHIAEGRTVEESLRLAGVERHIRALISGGAEIGRLVEGLASAALLRERQAAVRRQVRSAMIYPIVVMLVAVLVLVIVSVSVVPQLEATFIELGGELPAATQVVMSIAGALRDPRWWGFIGASSVIIGWTVRRSSRTSLGSAGRSGRVVHNLIDSAPIIGRVRKDADVAVATRVIATLAGNGAPLIIALQAGADSSTTSSVREGLAAARATVSRGDPMTSCAALSALFTPIERELLAVGEERGLLAAQWERLAVRRLEALESRLQTLGALVEPLMVVVVGLVVGGTVTALYLPSFRVLDLL